jgi:hypothetical protein
MKDSRIRELIRAARSAAAVAPAPGFSSKVAGAIRREARRRGPVSVFDGLALMFPGLAWAAVLVIGLCVAVELSVAGKGPDNLSLNVAAAAEHWLFTAN